MVEQRVKGRLAYAFGFWGKDLQASPFVMVILGFAWDFEGVTRYFTFAVLPFGLSTACFLLYQAFAPFSSGMAADVPQLFCVFR